MTQTAIPFLFMRGGTSRGPYFNRADLPEDRNTLAEVLIAAVGAGQERRFGGTLGGPGERGFALLRPYYQNWVTRA